MAAPQPYDRQYSFSTYQAQHPSDPLPGDELDAELNAVKASLDETQANLGIIQRTDGQLANQSVGLDQLKPEMSVGVAAAVPWAASTYFAANASVFYGLVLYRCITSHTSTGSFDVSKFLALADLSSVSFPPGGVVTNLLADGGVTTPKIADGNVTVGKVGSLAAFSLVGRYSGSSGAGQNITLHSSLAFAGAVLGLSAGAALANLAFTPANVANNGSDFASPSTTLANLGGVSTARQVIAGTGLTGGGTLAADRTFAVAYGTAAGTAAQGNDSRITGAVQAANNLSDVTAATARTNLGIKKYSTPQTTFTTSTSFNNAHGLGGVPDFFVLHLVCKTAEYGYAVDDIAVIAPLGASANMGAAVSADATNIYVRCGSGSGGKVFSAIDNTSATVNLTNANWYIRVTAMKIG